MARVPFSVGLSGSCKLDGSTVSVASDSRFASEAVTRSQRRKPSGFLHPLPYFFQRREYERANGTCKYLVYGGLRNTYDGYVGISQPFNSINNWDEAMWESTSVPAAIADRALIDARAGMKDMRVNLAQAFAERTQAMGLVASTAKDLVSLGSALRKGDVSKAIHVVGKYRRLSPKKAQNLRNVTRDVSKGIGSRWLEIQYGWKPMIQDVHGALESLSNKKNEDFWFTAHGKARDFSAATKIVGMNMSRESIVCKAEYGCRYTLLGIPDASGISDLNRFGITNPGLLAWELLPYSFVVDWFLPVGDYLDSFDALLGFNSLYSCKSEKITQEWQGKGLTNGWGPYTHELKFSSYKKNVVMRRTVQSGVPCPPLPRFKNPVSAGHMANAISLLAQFFGRK